MGYRLNMRRRNQMHQVLATASVLLLSGSLQAVPVEQLKENYQSIVVRNPFGLKPPPEPPKETVPEVPKPKVEVFLTGITSVGYPRVPKQAYFYTREQGKKEITYYTMTEDDEKDGIKVLEIDHEKRKVRVNMENRDTILSFETHGVPIAAVAARPGTPGALPLPGQSRPGVQPLPLPGAAPAPNVTYDANGQPIYQQQPTYGGGQVMPQAGNQFNTVNPGSGGLRQIPSRRIRGGNTYNAQPNPTLNGGGMQGGFPQQEQVATDPAEEYLRAHLNHAAHQNNDGARRNNNVVPLPPLPRIE
jgi:hypothetical protein